MTTLSKITACLTLLFVAFSAVAQVHVRGYYRKDGTYVRPHTRSLPDRNTYDNGSGTGGLNSYTRQPSTSTQSSIESYWLPGPYVPHVPRLTNTPKVYEPRNRPPSVKVHVKERSKPKEPPSEPEEQRFIPFTVQDKVVGVTDGDTIEVMIKGKAEKIRLAGLDCPESGQDFGEQAKTFTADACFGKQVSVQIIDVDRYGRYIGIVTLPDGSNLNQTLVGSGMAWWYEEYAPHDGELMKFQVQAMNAKVGLWSKPTPLAPWDFRADK